MTITIICDVCNKPVSRCTTQYIRELDELLFIVSCHSKFDRTRMPMSMFRDGWYVTEARAFKSKDVPDPVVTAKPAPINDNNEPDPPKTPQVLLCGPDFYKKPVQPTSMHDYSLALKDAV